ncbi:MAG: hypothetical protein JNM57_08320 [Cyclobacteriaceae bacterium]|nr:hypothetical protein [Cyclobacteriaceae bacterium]
MKEEYFDDGTLRSTVSIKNGLYEGEMKKYFKSGRIESIEKWHEGKRNGECLYFYESGLPMYKLSYKEDLLDGPSFRYNENGTVSRMGLFMSGRNIGDHLIYDSVGNFTERQTFNDKGELIYVKVKIPNEDPTSFKGIPIEILDFLNDEQKFFPNDTIPENSEIILKIRFGLLLGGEIEYEFEKYDLLTNSYKPDTTILMENSINGIEYRVKPNMIGPYFLRITTRHKNARDTLSIDGSRVTYKFFVKQR